MTAPTLDTQETIGKIVDSGVVAVLRGAGADTVVDTAEALAEGGVTAIELTADTPGVMDMLDDVTDALAGSDVVVGVGTVLDEATARSAILAGAEFVVQPTFSEEVVRVCNRYGVPVAPGVFTPTEAIDAYEAGADFVKVFPAKTGGPEHVSAIKGPLGQVPIMPTGGVDLDNAADFIDAGAVCVGAGSALVDDEAVQAGDFEAVTERAREFSQVVADARDE
ncbi:bifunctional 4-hydroxy-2-oxoglutarate aldolase/2-dehydro-3-deoxy-phosphogluconate aldolase [Halobium salinum]|uniref:Bifunctional 4-hydroxy-2-oxoglutarate aldolase/2-dehydro-3-deoxy-phosphogluconate aldolase n=1 Tax=Halobium salinum TaxID=1364940 RepID=A0ABD5P7J0_9EURY|nr:bifunctional 4-hydroxy-2-oxoglutarate aldolase/2-dehydro-3-deoxy-phosphogluconate aldolase [Halobium salinum]